MKELELIRKIKSVAFASALNDVPFVRIIDVMLIEDEKLYFVTARGKQFYRQLLENPRLAIVGMDENYTTVRINGKSSLLPEEKQALYRKKVFEQNPSLGELYDENQRDILDVFCIEAGAGDVFALGENPPTRKTFAFGGEDTPDWGYVIDDKCIGCGACVPACCTNAISEGEPYVIDNTLCLECGKCAEVCPVDAPHLLREQ